MKTTLYRYLLKEMWPTFFATLTVFVLIMMATKMISTTEWIINRGVHPGQVFKLTLFLMPNIILFALPAASLIAVLVAYLRLSSDNEITALNAAGISLFQTLPPVLILSFLGYVLASVIIFFGVPWGNKSLKDGLLQIVETNVDVNVKERVFYEFFDDVVFYVNHVSTRDKIMKDVFVMDRRDMSITNTILAKEGRILRQLEPKTVTLHFKDGHIFMMDRGLETARTMKFESYDLNIKMQDIAPYIASRKKSPKEMFVQELIYHLRKTPKGEPGYYDLVIKLLEKFTIPIAVLLMGLIGAPLGAQLKSKARTAGIFVGLAIFLLYYMCLMGTRSLGETGALTPWIGIWIPDLFLIACSIFLLKR